jgi:hypothetical protein
VVNAERRALGLSQLEVAFDDRRDEQSLADRIAGDPEATALALALLDRIAGSHSAPSRPLP